MSEPRMSWEDMCAAIAQGAANITRGGRMVEAGSPLHKAMLAFGEYEAESSRAPSQLDNREREAIANCLRVAAAKFAENAVEIDKVGAFIRSGGNYPMFMNGEAGAKSADALALEFRRQAEEAQGFASKVANACGESKLVEIAAKNLMRLCMQGFAREYLDKIWGKGETRKHVHELCEALGITYP